MLVGSFGLTLHGLESFRVGHLDRGERWLEDAVRLETILLQQHPAPFDGGHRDTILAAVARAKDAAWEASDREPVLAAFAEAVAALGDPHTVVLDRYELLGFLPVSWALYGSELRVLGARAAPEAVVGGRVVALDGVPTEAALEAIRRVVPDATESGFRSAAPRYLRTSWLLHRVGVADSPDGVTLTVESSGAGPVEFFLESTAVDDVHASDWPSVPPLPDGELPPYRDRPDEAYWLRTLPGHRAVYVRYRRAEERPGRPMKLFARDLAEAIDEVGATRVMVDVRGNGGGDPQLHIPLVRALEVHPRLGRPGSVLVLTDGRVYSAGILAVTDLLRRTAAVVVGDTVADRAAPTSDPRPFTLPHTGFRMNVATVLMGGDVGESAGAIPPDAAVVVAWQDWREGRDPVLETALDLEAARGLREPEVQGRPEPGGPLGADRTPAPLPAGRYAFDPLRALELSADREGGGHVAVVTGRRPWVLEPFDGGWAGGPYRLRAVADRGVEARRSDGSWEALRPISEAAPMERLLRGAEEDALSAFRDARHSHPGFRDLTGMGLMQEAHYLLAAGDEAAARGLVKIASELHPDQALLHLQHAAMEREAGEGVLTALKAALPAVAACVRRYRRTRIQNDLWLCL